MGDLGNKIGSIYLKDLTIPGSHDSGTYDMVVPACAAQGVNVYEQLRAGARYLDLRAMWHMFDYHIYHGEVASLNKLSSSWIKFNNSLKKTRVRSLFLTFGYTPGRTKKNYKRGAMCGGSSSVVSQLNW